MTVGTVASVVSLTTGSTVDIRPDAGVEWVLHNIYVESGKQVKVLRYDGTNSVTIDTVTGSLLAFCFHLTNTQYIRVQNLSGSDIYIGYDGMSVV